MIFDTSSEQGLTRVSYPALIHSYNDTSSQQHMWSNSCIYCMLNTIVQKFGQLSDLQQDVHVLLMAQHDCRSSQLQRLVLAHDACFGDPLRNTSETLYKVCTDSGFSRETQCNVENVFKKTKNKNESSKIKPQNCQTCIYNLLSDLLKNKHQQILGEAHHNIQQH